MTYAIIGIRKERDFKLVFGPVPAAEATAEFKKRVADDLAAEGGTGVVQGVLELFELRDARSHKLRHGEEDAKEEAASGKGGKKK